jgi:hypothetical protein
MGVAALNLPAFSEEKEFRAMAHKALDQWLDTFMPFFESKAPPNLKGLSDHFQNTRQMFLGACVQAAVERLYESLFRQRRADCPHCGQVVLRHAMRERSVSTLQGPFSLSRPYFYCAACQMGFAPLDQALGLAPEHHQFDIQDRAARCAGRLPFAEAATQFEELTGVSIGNHFCHDNLQAVGEAATLEEVLPSREETLRRIEQAQLPSGEKPILVVTTDGAMTPTREQAPRNEKRGPGRYQEVKGFRVYLIGPFGRIVHVASWHQIQDAADLRQSLHVAAQRIDQERVRVALVADGAAWVWNALEECFPQGRRILDYYHCAEHVWEVAEALHGEGACEAQEWAEAFLAELCLGKVSKSIAALTLTQTQSAAQREAIEHLATYLENQAERIHYIDDIEKGFHIGSGAMESANKFICHTRMKRSGAWWVVTSGNAMLRVRCAMYNGTFERVFQKYMTTNCKKS